MKNLSTQTLTALTFLTVNSFAFSFETVQPGETAMIQDILANIKTQVRKDFLENGIARRDAHAKQHGCVKAQINVLSQIGMKEQSSVFIPSKSYKSWIRFSNGSGKSQDDSEGDGRGMALKIIGAGDQGYQDILMINHPTFFVRNLKDYVEFTRTNIENGNPLKFFFNGINPLKWRLHEMNVARTIQGKEVSNPLAVQYWSMTPVLFGGSAVKFSARPCRAPVVQESARIGKNFLRHNMALTLNKQDSCFILGVQHFKDQEKTPIEDPTIEWSESVTPRIDIAQIQIPKQDFTSDAQMDFCENLSLSPWNFSKDHRPLGGINRGRKAIYDGISELRHQLNGKNALLPSGDETF